MERSCLVVLIVSLALGFLSVQAAAGHISFSGPDNGRTVTVVPGDSLSVSLFENPTTGYHWEVETSEGIALTGSTFLPSRSGLIGAGGTHTWYFVVRGGGQQTISAIYRRPWMPPTGDEERYTLFLMSREINAGDFPGRVTPHPFPFKKPVIPPVFPRNNAFMFLLGTFLLSR
ncbi:MAG: protease inhibitor I42 family protein [Methanolinea sp.]|nr:protease inhibitor I42 family protein [Methanolinea sp.]